MFADAQPPAAPPLTGGAAVLARIRAQRQASAQRAAKPAAAAASPLPVLVLYGSQTGTAREIARNISGEAMAKGLKAEAKALDEVRLAGLSLASTPVLVVITSSTGDGDAPDNALKAVADLKRAPENGQLKGVKFTLLGLGDSNYTRYMHVPRTVKNRLADLGAVEFYSSVEADEVSGLDGVVDPWIEGLLPVLKRECSTGASKIASATARPTVPSTTQSTPSVPVAASAATVDCATPASTTALAAQADIAGLWVSVPADWDIKGVPALVPCTVEVQWEESQDAVQQVQANEGDAPSPDQLSHRCPSGDYSPDSPFWATISAARLLTKPESDRRVLHLEFDIKGSGIAFQPGDSVAVLPQNDESLVERLLQRLGVDGDRVLAGVTSKGGSTGAGAQLYNPGQLCPCLMHTMAAAVGNACRPRSHSTRNVVLTNNANSPLCELDPPAGPALLPHLNAPCTLRHAFTNSLDLTSSLKKSLLRMLAEHCSNPVERNQLLYLTSAAGRQQYRQLVLEAQPCLLDVLTKLPSCAPPLAPLLEALPPLAPRPYSVTNAPCCGEEVLQVALSVVRVSTLYGTKLGVASSWLDQLAAPLIEQRDVPRQPRVAICMRKGGNFRPPASLDKHWIMVGPGTGVAPFRGFLQERNHRLQAGETGSGEAWLFFGCRQEDEDYIYHKDLEAFAADGTVTSLKVAFSRAGAEKVYVQHLMKQHGEHLACLIRAGAHVFVCGDGFKMAKDVHATLVELLGEDGEQLLLEMVKKGQYVRDIWS